MVIGGREVAPCIMSGDSDSMWLSEWTFKPMDSGAGPHVIFGLFRRSRMLSVYNIDYDTLAIFIALSEGGGDEGKGRTGDGAPPLQLLLCATAQCPSNSGDATVAEVMDALKELRDEVTRNGSDFIAALDRLSLPRAPLCESGAVARSVICAIKAQTRNARREIFAFARFAKNEMVRDDASQPRPSVV